jgi:uncharacterized protein YprB with RNaseH-like and TPR domain
MLTSTFVHLSGVGYSTEQRLWLAGARCWDDFLARAPDVRLGAARLDDLRARIAASRESLMAGDYRFFNRCLPRRDQWRAFPEFSRRVLYLDIETTGGTDFDDVTVIGLHDGRTMRQFVRGENLLEAEDLLREAALLVTFFGTGFDVPVLRRLFPRLPFDQLHADLCHNLRRLGYSGGLKVVELQLGLARPPEITGLDGWDAVRLWREWRHGSAEARALLLHYNRADVENMLPLMALTYDRLRAKTLAPLTRSAPQSA